MVFIQHPFKSDIKVLDFASCTVVASEVRDTVGKHFGYTEFGLLYNGKSLSNTEVIPTNSTVHVVFSLPGGKGGFGSMLRAIGAQIEKTTNREACRDLSGRRLRDINEEQRLKKWIAKKAEREAEKLKRRKERLERLKQKPPHMFFDFEYERKISELPERINDALNEGLQKAKQTLKRPHEDAGPSKPKKTWLADEFLSTSSESDLDEMSSSDSNNSAKKPRIESTESSECCSDVSQSQPNSSKIGLNSDSEESLTGNATEVKSLNNQIEENSYDDLIGDKSNNSEVVSKAVPSFSVKDTESEDSFVDKTQCEPTEIKKPSDQKRYRDDCNEKDINLHKGENGLSDDQSEVIKNITFNESNQECNDSKITDTDINKKEENKSESPTNEAVKETKSEEYSPINLLDFQHISDIEDLGLDRLKTELMSRGLKCGGSLSDRAQRLWKIRGLQPNQYPSNLLAKSKK